MCIVYCVCGGKCIMFDHFDSRDPSRLLCIIAMTMTLFIPWPFHHHRPIDQHTTASGLSTWWFGAREGKCHCSALGLVDGTRATTHRAWRGWPWRERWGQMVDGGCTGEGNIGKHGYLCEKMCHTPELDEHETYETLALKQPGWPASQCLNPCVWRQQGIDCAASGSRDFWLRWPCVTRPFWF